jgi:DNA-binding response OmpR family regulator
MHTETLTDCGYRKGAADAMLTGRRVILVEDEYFIASDLKKVLEAHGGEVIGPIGDVAKAASVISSDGRIDCAVLDIDIKGQAVFPLVRLLREQGIAWIYVSGYSEALVPVEFRAGAHIEKPVSDRFLVSSIIDVTR